MNDLRPRLMTATLEQALAFSPVVVLTGARQTGKSTLAQAVRSAGTRRYVTLDDLDALALAQRDPDSLLVTPGPMTIDEVQRAPELLLAVKRAVDRDRQKGRFLLTGSANLLLHRRVSETLAGRAIYLTLRPMVPAELEGDADAGPWSRFLECPTAAAALSVMQSRRDRTSHWWEFAERGGFPPAALERDPAARTRWFEGYERTYLERDLQQLAAIDALVDFRHLLRVAALRVGTLVNQSKIAAEAGLSQPTAHRYLNLLEASYLVDRLPPFVANRKKRLVRTPKLYFGDTGLVAHLAGWRPGEKRDEAISGGLLENLVLVCLRAWADTVSPRPEVLFWRSATGEEVDFVIEQQGTLLPIEVKSGGKPGPDDVRWIEAFLAEYPRRAAFGLVLTGGQGDPTLVRQNVLAGPLGRAF